ncbi:DEKNAAC104974 [Brettanomyces naardenensis]|uniref:DEKNAAC104974 n=1 Tax=Brettanomyces naardenensis TaxID=13370 RepID=A0A448YSJ4_BRENA|nr:DEKNAAC104974 [Brettanomyces naardenensis]
MTLDYIPYLDDGVEVDSSVELQVQEEMNGTNTDELHPYVVSKFPDITREHPLDIPITRDGMGMERLASRYTSVEGDSKLKKEDKLKLLTSYSMLRSRTLEVFDRNMTSIENEWLVSLDELERLNDRADLEIGRKRKQIDDLFASRKKRCLEFSPINDFLRNRWNDKIDELINVGVQVAERELEKETE